MQGLPPSRRTAVPASAAQTDRGRPSSANKANKANAVSVLARLSCLPVELQDAVLRHLPLADLLIWQKMNRNLAHRIRVGSFLEQAVCRSLGRALPRAALTRDGYERLLRPWLASFAADPLGPDWGGARFRPATLFCATTRTLRATDRLGWQEQTRFRLPVSYIQDAHFTPDARCLIVRASVCEGVVLRGMPWYVFEWDGSSWQRGSAFAGAQAFLGILCAADGCRVAVVERTTEILIREKKESGVWHQTARLVPVDPLFHHSLHMTFSADGRSLAVHSGDGAQYVWDLDARGTWHLNGSFLVAWQFSYHQKSRFSLDGRWLLMQQEDQNFQLACRDGRGQWVPGASLISRAEGMPLQALFMPCSREILLDLVDGGVGALSVWQLEGTDWSEQGLLQHPDGLSGPIRFSQDGQLLLTRSRKSGAQLWTKDSKGHWAVCKALTNSVPTGCAGNWLQRFDPAGRWLVTGYVRLLSNDERWDMWTRDAQGHWRCQPADALCSRTKVLEVTADGQHLVLIHQPRPRGRAHSLRLLQLHEGRWRIKADYPVPRDRYDEVVPDPFGCHLAAFGLSEPVVTLLRLKEAAFQN